MNIDFTQILRTVTGLLAGGLVGIGFGLLQNSALRRNEALHQTGKLNRGVGLVPGSMRRVAFLMMALALVQIVCPLLFSNGVQWWVSGGVVAGYGYILLWQLRQKLASSR